MYEPRAGSVEAEEEAGCRWLRSRRRSWYSRRNPSRVRNLSSSACAASIISSEAAQVKQIPE